MREVETIARHLEISLGELIHRANLSLAKLANRRIEGENIPGLEGNIAQAEAHLDELNNRLEGRRAERTSTSSSTMRTTGIFALSPQFIRFSLSLITRLADLKFPRG